MAREKETKQVGRAALAGALVGLSLFAVSPRVGSADPPGGPESPARVVAPAPATGETDAAPATDASPLRSLVAALHTRWRRASLGSNPGTRAGKRHLARRSQLPIVEIHEITPPSWRIGAGRRPGEPR